MPSTFGRSSTIGSDSRVLRARSLSWGEQLPVNRRVGHAGLREEVSLEEVTAELAERVALGDRLHAVATTKRPISAKRSVIEPTSFFRVSLSCSERTSDMSNFTTSGSSWAKLVRPA